MEWEIPIPPVKGTRNRDYSIVQRAWSVSFSPLFFSPFTNTLLLSAKVGRYNTPPPTHRRPPPSRARNASHRHIQNPARPSTQQPPWHHLHRGPHHARRRLAVVHATALRSLVALSVLGEGRAVFEHQAALGERVAGFRGEREGYCEVI